LITKSRRKCHWIKTGIGEEVDQEELMVPMSEVLLWLAQPRFLLLILVVDAVAAAFCLAALWAGESRQHWVWRCMGVCGLLTLLLPIRAYEPLLLLLIVAPLLAVASAWHASQQARLLQTTSSEASHWRFGLSELFQALTLFGMGLGLWVAARQGEPLLEWRSLPIAALLIATFAWRAWQVAAHPRQWQNWLKLACGLAAIMVAESFLLRDWMETSDIFGTTGIRGWRGLPRDVVMVPMLYVPLAVLVILGARLMHAVSSKSCKHPSRKRFTRMIAGVLVLGASLPMAWLYYRMLGPSSIPPSTEGNAYHKLSELGARIPQATPASARNVLEEAEQLLQTPASVALDYRNASLVQQNKEVQPLLHLSSALRAESARQATLGKYDEATKLAICHHRLGILLQRGGTALHAQLGLVFESRSIGQISEMRSKLSNIERQSVIAELQQSEKLCDSVDEILIRNKVWRDLWERWRYRLNLIVVEESWRDSTDLVDRDLALGWDQRAAHRRLLAADLAIRAFQQDEGRLPGSLAELTPKFLPAPLPDPFSGEPLRYLPSGSSFLLYSVGPDLQDNGGQAPKPGQRFDPIGYDIGL
jgi:hypothetical protein